MAKRPSHNHSRVSGCLVALGFVVIIALAGALELWRLTEPLSPGSRARTFVNIPAGATPSRIGELLTERHVTQSKEAFVFAVRWLGVASHLHPGHYEFSPGMRPSEIARAIADGRVSMNDVVIPEGFTLWQIADRLAARGMVDRDQFLAIARHDGKLFRTTSGFTPPSNDLEGYLFPDTYEFGKNSDPRTVLLEMVTNFSLHVVRKHPDVQDWREPVIVAAMVEREARVPEDRPLIAGVIYNRLKRRMPLQIDATVQYTLPEHKARLMFSDLRKISSPYNTYEHAGLPPGPICCPGVASIDAALNPTPSDYLYYVSGPGDKHIFAGTYEEHLGNIARVRALAKLASPAGKMD